MPEYEEYAVATAPVQRSGFWGTRLQSVLGIVKDAFVAATKAAIKLRYPRYAPPDALQWIADERNLEPRYQQSDLGYREYLRRAWSLWTQSGTWPGMKLALELAGYPNVTLLETWDILEVDPATWWRFWLVFRPPFPFASDHPDGRWGDPGVWGDGGVWDYAVPREEVRRLARTVNKWKPADAECVRLIFVFEGELWGDPGGTWGDPGTWGSLVAYEPCEAA